MYPLCIDPNYKWTVNSLNQDPCVVASYLATACTGSQPVDNPSLQAKGHYASPGGADATRCKCSTAYYSMISACAICQFGQDMTFAKWTANCTASFDQFPESIPDGTRVPHWAYLPIGSNDTWDSSAALAVVNLPESTPAGSTNPTGVSAPTGFSTTGSSSSPGLSNTPTPSTTSEGAAGGGGGTRKVVLAPRAIAGVIAAVVALAVFAILAFIFFRRCKSNPSSTIDPGLLRSTTPFGGEKLNYHQSGSTTTTSTTSPYPHIPSTMTMPPMRLYNPSDPTTFPPPVNIQGSSNASSELVLRPLSRNMQANGSTYAAGYARGYHGGAEL